MTEPRVLLARTFVPAGAEDDVASSAFRASLIRSLGAAYRLAAVILGSRYEAEDATQDAVERAWRARSSLREVDRFDAWFQRIVVNTCRDRVRRGRAAAALVALPDHDSIGIHGDPASADPFTAAVAREFMARAFSRLNVDQRAVVAMRFYLDLEVDEIARRLGTRPGTVKSRLHRALATLRAAWERDE